MKKNRLSGAALILCYLLLIATGTLYYPKWKQPGGEATISWDAASYYMYLPAQFIYKDLKKCAFGDSILKQYAFADRFEAGHLHPSGNYVLQYAAGQAVIYSPFFLIGHLVAKSSDTWPADGFSYPYQVSIGLGMLLYALLGLCVLRKALLYVFTDKAVAVTLVVIVFSTNYLNYAAIDGAMTHNTLFTVYALLILFIIKFYKRPTLPSALAVGLLIGIATLTRPTEIIAWILPACWGITRTQDIRERLRFMAANVQYPVSALLAFGAVTSVQLIYWKRIAGSWLVYSYGNQGFSFLRPHIIECLFSYRAGWFVYTPVMILSLIGLAALYKNHRQYYWSIFLFSLVFMYVCFSWDIWWYGGSLGKRAMIQAYPALAFPLAAFFQRICSGKTFLKITTAVFLLCCIWYNLWLTHQAHRGGLLRLEETTKEYFWATLGRYEKDEDTEKLLDNPDRYKGIPKNARQVYANNFDADTSAYITTENAISGKSIFLDKTHQHTQEYFFIIDDPGKTWIRASAVFRAVQYEPVVWKMVQFVVKFYDGDQVIKTSIIRVFRVLRPGETKEIYMDVKIPREKFDRASVFFWNSESDRQILIDDLKVISFE